MKRPQGDDISFKELKKTEKLLSQLSKLIKKVGPDQSKANNTLSKNIDTKLKKLEKYEKKIDAIDDFINTGRSQKCDRMAMAIGKDADEGVLKQFIDGTEHELFNAGNAKQLHELLEASRYRQVGAVKLLRE